MGQKLMHLSSFDRQICIFTIPEKRDPFFGQLNKWFYDVGVALNKSAIEF